jgi:hypothetical protein
LDQQVVWADGSAIVPLDRRGYRVGDLVPNKPEYRFATPLVVVVHLLFLELQPFSVPWYSVVTHFNF